MVNNTIQQIQTEQDKPTRFLNKENTSVKQRSNDKPISHKPATKKEKAVARIYATNPKLGKTGAYKEVYNVRQGTSKESVYQQASATFKKPQVKNELAKYSNMFENIIIETAREYAKSDKQWQRTLSVELAKYGHDKIHGKATNRTITGKIDTIEELLNSEE